MIVRSRHRLGSVFIAGRPPIHQLNQSGPPDQTETAVPCAAIGRSASRPPAGATTRLMAAFALRYTIARSPRTPD